MAPVEPWNGAPPKSKIPPSDATVRYARTSTIFVPTPGFFVGTVVVVVAGAVVVVVLVVVLVAGTVVADVVVVVAFPG